MLEPKFRLSRREFARLAAAGVLTGASVPWVRVARPGCGRPPPRARRVSCCGMDGGPSQQHTFDPKPAVSSAPPPPAFPASTSSSSSPSLPSAWTTWPSFAP